MLKQQTISVITVVFNGDKTIQDTIESVKKQTYPNIEYIIVDGGSSDGTLDIINQQQSFISASVSEKDNGIYDAMNKGVSLSTGDWIIFLNSDDYFYSDDVVERLIKSVTDEVFVVGKTIIRNGNSEQPFNSIPIFGLYLQIPFMHPSMMVARSAFSKHGNFLLEYKIASDCDFIFRLLASDEKYKIVNFPTVVMRGGGASNKHFILGRLEYMTSYIANFGNYPAGIMGFIISIVLKCKSLVGQVLK
jgi:glycosyltransferase involved in cell wall biosynthesis